MNSASFLVAVFGIIYTVIIAALAWWYFSPLLSSKLGLIDDHEIIVFLGGHNSISVTEIPRLLLEKTEIGRWGDYTRLRPVYYLLRLLETSAYGTNASLWYLDRIVMVAITAALSSWLFLLTAVRFKLVKALYSPALWLGILPGLAVLSINAWTDTATRIGPSEIFLAIGFVGFMFAGFFVLVNQKSVSAWIFLGLTTIVLIGSKENGIAFLPLFLFIFLLTWPSQRKLIARIVVSIVCFFALYISLGIGLGMLASGGQDVYGHKRSLLKFIVLLPLNVQVMSACAIAVIALLGEYVIFRSSSHKFSAGFVPKLRNTIILFPLTTIAVSLLYILIFEAFFYQVSYGLERYQIVTQIAVIGIWSSSLLAILRVFSSLKLSKIVAGLTVVSLIVVAAPYGQISRAFAEFRPLSISKAQMTQNIWDSLTNAGEVVKSHPAEGVRLIASVPFDYESLFSTSQYIHLFTGRSGFQLQLQFDEESRSLLAPELASLVDEMEAKSLNGDKNWHVSPASKKVPGQPDICFYFTELPLDTAGCSQLIQIK